MKDTDTYTIDEINKLLNGWPEGTEGHEEEEALIKDLYTLSQVMGFGRMAQIALQMDMLCNCHDYDSIAAFKRRRFEAMGWSCPI